MKRILVLATVGLMLFGCGTTSLGHGAAPSPSSGPNLGYDVSVTQTDHAASLHVGQKLLVTLHAATGMSAWAHPNSSDPTRLTPIVDPAATAVIGVTVGAFQALAPGQVEITAFAGPNCAQGQACPMYAILYSLQVTITA